jgi:hypothetical protein
MRHEERKAEDPEGVLSLQLAVVDVDVELLGKAVHGQSGEFPADRVDVGQVVTGMIQVTSAGQHQPTSRAAPRLQRGGEAALGVPGNRENHARRLGIITRQAIRRGTFTSAPDLIDAIRTFIDGYNQRCAPFRWTKTADQILTKANRQRSQTERHATRGVGPGLSRRQVPRTLGWTFLLLWNTFSGSYFALTSASRW